MKLTIVTIVLTTLVLAGCTTPQPAPPDYGRVVDTQVHDTEVGARDRATYNVTLSSAGGIGYDLFVRDGKMELTIMPASEREHYMAGKEVRTLAKDSGSHLQSIRGFGAGEYIVGVKCTNIFDACPYNLVLKIHRKSEG